MKKKITKASKRRLVVFGSISLFIFAYLLVLAFYNYIKISSLNKEYNDLENKLSELKSEEKNLKNDINKLQDPDYLARYARENYSYSKDGEIIIKIDEEEEDKKETREKNNKNYIYYSLIGIFTFVLLILIFSGKGKKKSHSNKRT